MVELKLESIEEQNMPRDCFISVRVGEMQKLSRLAATRVYRFPQAGERRYGKIEVFRRIGACNVDIDPSNSNVREINVDCKESGFGNLGLHIAVEGDEIAKKKLEDMPTQGKKAGTKVKAAKDYLSKHGLEVRLSEAMQAVLRDRPENPTEYLAMKLLGHTPGDNAKLQSILQSDTIAVKDETAYQETPRQLEPLKENAAPLATKAAPQVPMLPFGNSYYKKNFPSINKSAFASLHCAFPRAARREEPDRTVKATSPNSGNWMLQPSVGTWCTRLTAGESKKADSMRAGAVPTTTKILPFKEFYKVHFRQMPPEGFEAAYKLFPKRQRQATQVDSIREHVAKSFLVAAKNGELTKTAIDIASTCEQAPDSLRDETSLRLLSASRDGSLESSVRNIVAASSKADWKQMPSIGTWCTPLFSSKGKTAPQTALQSTKCMPPSDLIQKYMQAPSPFLRVQALAHAATVAAKTEPLIAAGLAKAAVDVACSMVTSTPAMHPSVAIGLAMMAVSAAEAQSAAATGLIIAAAGAALQIAEAGPTCQYYHKPSVASWLRLQQCKTDAKVFPKAPPPSPILPFGGFYQRHFRGGTVESFTRSLFDNRPNGAQ